MREAPSRSALRVNFIPAIFPDKLFPSSQAEAQVRQVWRQTDIRTPTTNPTISVVPIRVICDVIERWKSGVVLQHVGVGNVGGCLLLNVHRYWMAQSDDPQ